MIACSNLTLRFGKKILFEDVSLKFKPGYIYGIIGANGAGKTTLLRAISGMVRPRGGRVVLDGVDRAGRSPEDMARAGIAHVPEGQGVIAELTVEENLRIGTMSCRASPGDERNGPPRSPRHTTGSACSRTAAAGWPPPCPAASGRCW